MYLHFIQCLKVPHINNEEFRWLPGPSTDQANLNAEILGKYTRLLDGPSQITYKDSNWDQILCMWDSHGNLATYQASHHQITQTPNL